MKGTIMFRFEIFKDGQGGFRFRFRSPGGDILFASEAWETKEAAMAIVEAIRQGAPGALLVDQTTALA
jgi:uncharacterized protein YegP (UPF0339 family)